MTDWTISEEKDGIETQLTMYCCGEFRGIVDVVLYYNGPNMVYTTSKDDDPTEMIRAAAHYINETYPNSAGLFAYAYDRRNEKQWFQQAGFCEVRPFNDGRTLLKFDGIH
jgi:hypothetical protein